MTGRTEEKTIASPRFKKIPQKFLENINAVCFDFGGCLDGNGLHTRELFWRTFQSTLFPTSPPVTAALDIRNIYRPLFQEAYTVMDQQLITNAEALGLGLERFNTLQWQYLIESLLTLLPSGLLPEEKIEAIVKTLSASVTEAQRACLSKNKEVLFDLRRKFPHLKLAVISNFTGNLDTILKEEGYDFFDVLSDSYWIGASKPHSKIFLDTLKQLEVSPHQALMIGDQLERDVQAAMQLGMQAAHITERPEERISDYFSAASVAMLFEDVFQKKD